MPEKITFDEVLQTFKGAIEKMAEDAVINDAKKFSREAGRIIVTTVLDNAVKSLHQLFDNTRVIELRNRVAELPGEIAGRRKDLNTLRDQMRTVRQSLADAELGLKEAEAALIAEIAGEVSPGTGKPAFSNDAARKAELAIRKKDDGDYIAAMEHYIYARDGLALQESDMAAAEVEVKNLETEFMATVKQLDSINAEIGFYAAALHSAGEIKF